ncbi:uncharacterized protein [Cicer arietinum]|uniref:uncharacterized protein n=1 Tax=Cicer arietinum TaxID=3827 RepID=UPI003CC5C08A
MVQDSLVEQTSQGTFVPHRRTNILPAAIGKPKHPGRVRVVGRGVGIRQYFGSRSHYASTPPAFSSHQIEELTNVIKNKVLLELSQQNPNLFMKRSFSVELPIPEDEDDDIPEQCKLYVDNNDFVVAYADAYKLGPTLHNQLLDNDMVRVLVTKVLDANDQVHIPTDEVTTVGHASNTFIQWPKRLLRLVSDKLFITYAFSIYT